MSILKVSCHRTIYNNSFLKCLMSFQLSRKHELMVTTFLLINISLIGIIKFTVLDVME